MRADTESSCICVFLLLRPVTWHTILTDKNTDHAHNFPRRFPSHQLLHTY
jgi:hypothetical protein